MPRSHHSHVFVPTHDNFSRNHVLVVFGDVQVLATCSDVDLFEKQGFDLGDLASRVLNSIVGV